jgi:SPP1 family predicted phage head-tail adaptor
MLQSRIRRGELDREITFLKKIIGSNETNEDEDLGWTRVATDPDVFAKVIQRPGKEMMIADKPTFVQTTLFIVDYRTDLTIDNRIHFNSKVYAILSVTEHESGRDRYTEIAAEILSNILWT